MSMRRAGSMPAAMTMAPGAPGPLVGAGGSSGELLGVRRWLQNKLVGGSLDDDLVLSPTGRRRGTLLGTRADEPALGLGSGNEVAHDLGVARSIADKFLILALVDEGLRPFYATQGAKSVSIPAIKRDLVEALLSALRCVMREGPQMSLEAHRELSENHLHLLRQGLRAAVREHCEAAPRCAEAVTPDEMADALLDSPGMPFLLLPKRDERCEAAEQAEALHTRGADEGAVRTVGGMHVAPLKVPLARRRQTLACVVGASLIPGSAFLFVASLLYWRKTWPVLLPYLTWAWAFDRSPWRGGMRVSDAVRRWALWRNWAAYFPASLIKADPAADFSGERPMLMGYHPHGILSFGCQLAIGTEACGWAEKFPSLTPRVCTLNMNIAMPFLREIIGRLGAIPADAGAIKSVLKPGNAVVLVVGGAAEALDTKPGEYVLTLARRNGFFRLALQHGADLVPTFGFGENDLFEVLSPSSLIRAIQLKAYKMLSFSMPVFYGRGVFTYNMGMLPFRRPLTVVVGQPIRCERVEHPTQEQIDKVKHQYIEALRKLHSEWSPRLEPGRESSLIVL